MTTLIKKPDIKTLQSWVYESHWVSSEWRKQSWQDEGMYDGSGQWPDADFQEAEDAGVIPLTINRTFPVINLLLGSQGINKTNMDAKARTQDDSEIAQVMTESIAFTMDQNDGPFLVSDAFKDAIIPGFGCLYSGLNPDPRKEKLLVACRDWKEIFWDAFASPWFTPHSCRYVFHHKWMDLADLEAMFPEKAKEIADTFHIQSEVATWEWGTENLDEATEVEEEKRTLSGSDWVDAERKRVRPAELWYTVFDKAWFATFPDGRTIEMRDDMPASYQYELIQSAQEVVGATVKRMRVATFLSDLLIQDLPTPFHHDEYPFIPFVGYLDKYGFPFGVPRQIREQDMEVNKRRSMALALLKSRRVLTESDVAKTSGGLEHVYEEVNKLDSMVVVDPGKIDRIVISEHQELVPGQVAILHESEREIQEISGPNAEQLGLKSNVTSRVGLDRQVNQASTITAPLFESLRRSLKILGQQLQSNIQGFWTGQKVLRITDRLSGAERFVALNEPIELNNGMVAIKNNITQGKYDIIVSEAPRSDTVREQNLALVQEVIKKSPPEMAPPLLQLSFELMDLPNKEKLLAKIRPILGMAPGEEDLTAEELKQKAMEAQQAQQEAQDQQSAVMQQMTQLEIENKHLENEKIRAEIQAILAKPGVEQQKADAQDDKVDVDAGKLQLDAFKTGFETQKGFVPIKVP